MKRRFAVQVLVVLAPVLLVVPGVPGVAVAEGPPPLPPEAFAACSGKAAGDACAVDFEGHHITGTCAPLPDDGRLFCRPSGPPPTP